MIIEVRGTGVHNKGAELMFCAIRQQLLEADPSLQFAVDPLFGPFEARARYRALSKVRSQGRGRARLVAGLISPAFRKTYGLVVDRDIDAVLDASGFAFGDQWGPEPSEFAAREAAKWRRRQRPVVLLPQAFGPFSSKRLADACKRLVDSVSLTFARDEVSFEHLNELVGSDDRVRLAPDFTNVVESVLPGDCELPERFVGIVPNIRMLDRTSDDDSRAYIGFLADCIRAVREREFVPVFVFHARAADLKVATAVEEELGFPLQTIDESRPECLKGILGRASLVIGSRFHAIVGALSQGVPSIVAGWSHKYDALLKDYRCPEMLLKPTCPREQLADAVDRALSTARREGLVERLGERGKELRQQVDEMFALTAQAIGVPPGARHEQ